MALAHGLDGAHNSRSTAAEPLVAVDFAHPMLRRASGKAESVAGFFRRIEFVEADALCLPFPDGAFDLVATAFGFRNLVNYAAGVRELHRVLAPGGWLAILEFAEPESALVRRLFQFYFHHVLPAIGGAISGNPGAYNYLPKSVAHFPTPKDLVDLIQGCGFSGIEYDSWTCGIVTLHTARVAE